MSTTTDKTAPAAAAATATTTTAGATAPSTAAATSCAADSPGVSQLPASAAIPPVGDPSITPAPVDARHPMIAEAGAATPVTPVGPTLAPTPDNGNGAAAAQLPETAAIASILSSSLPHLPSGAVVQGGGPLGMGSGAAAMGSSGGFSPPVLPVKAPAAAAPEAVVEVGAAPAPPRALPRKVSLRFAPRDGSAEGKLSAHGYLPFQKLTAPVSSGSFVMLLRSEAAEVLGPHWFWLCWEFISVFRSERSCNATRDSSCCLAEGFVSCRFF